MTGIQHGTCPVCGQTIALYGPTGGMLEGQLQTHSYNGERCDGAQQDPVEALEEAT